MGLFGDPSRACFNVLILQVAALENSKSALQSQLQTAKSTAVRAQKRFSMVHGKVNVVIELEHAQDCLAARDERIEELSQELGERDEELRRQRREMSTLVTALELRAEELGLPDDFADSMHAYGRGASASVSSAAQGAGYTLRCALLLEAAKWREAAAHGQEQLHTLRREHEALQGRCTQLQSSVQGTSQAVVTAEDAAAAAAAERDHARQLAQQQHDAAVKAKHERDAALDYIEKQRQELAAVRNDAAAATAAAAAARQQAAKAVGDSTQARGKATQVELVQRSTNEALQRTQQRADAAEQALRRAEVQLAEASTELRAGQDAQAHSLTEYDQLQQRCADMQRELALLRSKLAQHDTHDAAAREQASAALQRTEAAAAERSKELLQLQQLLRQEQQLRTAAETRAQQAAVEAARARDEARELQQLLEGSRMAKAVAVTQLNTAMREHGKTKHSSRGSSSNGSYTRAPSFQHTAVTGSRGVHPPPVPPTHGTGWDSSEDSGSEEGQLAHSAAATARRMVREAIHRSVQSGGTHASRHG